MIYHHTTTSSYEMSIGNMRCVIGLSNKNHDAVCIKSFDSDKKLVQTLTLTLPLNRFQLYAIHTFMNDHLKSHTKGSIDAQTYKIERAK